MAGTRVTKDSIGKLRPPASGNKVLWDSRDKGFGVRITAAGVISFVFRYVINGRERRLTIGVHKDGKGGSAIWTLAAAREEYVKLRGEVARGNDPLEGRERARAAPTVASLTDDYLAEARQHKRPASLKEDERMIKKIIKPRLGTKKVRDVTITDVERFRSSLSKTPSQANRALSLLRTMFNIAIKNGERADNPARGGRQGVQRYHEEKRDNWLSAEEINRLLAALNKYPDQNRANIIRLLLLTGARRGEALNATWGQFDLDSATWVKPGHMTKQRRMTHTPLSAQTVTLLANMKPTGAAPEDYLFPGQAPGKPATEIVVRRVWLAVCKEAGVTAHLHDLRHTFASHLVSGGHSLHIVGKLLGHVDPKTTARYSHLADAPVRAVADKFGELVEEAANNGQVATVHKIRPGG